MKKILENIVFIFTCTISIVIFCSIKNLDVNTEAALIVAIITVLSYLGLPKEVDSKLHFITQIIVTIVLSIIFYWIFITSS